VRCFYFKNKNYYICSTTYSTSQKASDEPFNQNIAMRKKLLLLCCLCATGLQAQRLEHHDLILFSMSQTSDSLWRPVGPRFLTAYNRTGYNNQPSFFSNNELYLSVQTPEDTTQTDIYALDLAASTRTRVTATTATAEYSPTLMPGGKRFSAVRVEEDGRQRLWSFPLDRSDNGRPEISKIEDVGYHCWLRDTLLALFIVGDNSNPHTLQLVGTKAQKTLRIASYIGRCLQKHPNGSLVFVQKPTDQTWFLKKYDLQKQAAEVIVKMPSGTEDFVILPDGAFLCGNGSKLWQYHPRRQQEWREVADLAKYGIKKIGRLALSKEGRLVIVTP
jgi:hypothetical protein